MIRAPWHPLAFALALTFGATHCGWTLPAPDIALDAERPPHDSATTTDRGAHDTGLDTPLDTPDAPPRPPDATPRDGAPLDAAPLDAALLDVASDTSTADLHGDSHDADDGTAVRDVVIPDGGCLAPAFRMCFTGDRATLGAGYCREGAQFCEATMHWSTTCEGEITRDCTDRVCGSDGCEGSCGACPPDRVCDDTGHCVAPSPQCGPANFTVACGAGNCPANSTCVGGRCRCNANFEARHCDAVPCPSTGCDGTDWWCAPAPFCGGGAITCTGPSGSFLCPRWSVCDTRSRACVCRAGFEARRCDGALCTNCPGTEYECVPTRAM